MKSSCKNDGFGLNLDYDLFLQKLNPGIEAPVEKLMDHIKDSLEDKKKSTEYTASYRAVEDSNEEKICFTVNSKLAGLPFTWKFSGKPANKDMVCPWFLQSVYKFNSFG